jgi:hypothetical protein
VPLEEVVCLGVTERYQESLQLLERRTGLRLPSVHVNVNPKSRESKHQLSADEEQLLRGQPLKGIACVCCYSKEC